MAVSPFRYPGGKGRLLKTLRPLLVERNLRSFADLFVGGGSVLLDIAVSLPDAELFANDLHEDVAAFWRVVVSDVDELLSKVEDTRPTVEQFRGIRDSYPTEDIERAFKILFLNRCSFSGIGVNPIGGWKQQSAYTVDCRWNRDRLVKQILECAERLKDRTTVTNEDALSAPWADRVYLDPPYVKQGPALYYPRGEAPLGGQDLHDRLALYLEGKSGWVLSYDDHPDIHTLYSWATIRRIDASYSISSSRGEGWDGKGKELVVTP